MDIYNILPSFLLVFRSSVSKIAMLLRNSMANSQRQEIYTCSNNRPMSSMGMTCFMPLRSSARYVQRDACKRVGMCAYNGMLASPCVFRAEEHFREKVGLHLISVG